jgi:hypothetical protein
LKAFELTSKTALTPSSTSLSSSSLPPLFLPLLPLWIPCSVVPSHFLTLVRVYYFWSRKVRGEDPPLSSISVTRSFRRGGFERFPWENWVSSRVFFLCFLLRDSCEGCRLRSIFLGSRIAVLYSVKESNFDFSLVAPAALCCRGDNLIFI